MKRSVKMMTIFFLLFLVQGENGDNVSDKCQEKRNAKTAIDIKAETEQLVTNFLKWEKELKRKNPKKFDFDRASTVLRKLRVKGTLCLVTRFLDATDLISMTRLNSMFYQKIRGTVSRYKNHLNQNFIDDFEKFFIPKFPQEQLVSTYFSIFCQYFGTNEKRWTRGEDGNLRDVKSGDKLYLEDDLVTLEFAGGKRQKHMNMLPLVVEENGIYKRSNFMTHFEVRMPSEDYRTDLVVASPWDGVTLVSQLTPQNFGKLRK